MEEIFFYVDNKDNSEEYHTYGYRYHKKLLKGIGYCPEFKFFHVSFLNYAFAELELNRITFYQK